MNSNPTGKTHDDLTPMHAYVTFMSTDDADDFKDLVAKKNYRFLGCIPCCAYCGCPAWAENELLFGQAKFDIKNVD